MSHMYRPYQICTRCVMDTTDPDIVFDGAGVCNHCLRYDQAVQTGVIGGDAGRAQVTAMVERIKRDGAGKPFDCVIGVSGGVDSTFVAYKVATLGLRPLAVHLDNGWDSELAVKNIENVLRRLGIELYTHVLNWEGFRDLQLAFLKASTPDSEIPSDHAIFAVVHQVARSYGVKYIIGGQNLRTESHLPLAWSQGHADWKYIKAVHERFGTVPLRSFPHQGFWRYRMNHSRHVWFDILNYLDYSKTTAMRVLEQELGWRYYGGKHYESIYTRFYQGYILPRKFGYDKRRTHLSSLVCSGERTRDEALRELTSETYPAKLQAEDRDYVCKKLGLSEAEFEAILHLPKRSYWDYPSHGQIYQRRDFQALRWMYRRLRGKPPLPAPLRHGVVSSVPVPAPK